MRDKVSHQRSEIGGRRPPRLNTPAGTPVQRGKEDRRQRNEFKHLRFRSTFDIIEAAENGLLPDKVIPVKSAPEKQQTQMFHRVNFAVTIVNFTGRVIATHPQRWTDNQVEWTKELIWQNTKNILKRWMVTRRQG